MKKIFYLIFFLLPFFLAAQNPVPYKGTGYIYFTDSTIMQTYVPLNATGSERAILRSNSTSANPHENREFAYEGPVLKWVEQLPGSGGTSGDGGTVFRTNSVTPTTANVFPLGVPWTTNDRLDMLRNGSFAYWSGSAWIKNSMDNGFNVPNSLRVTATQDTTSYTPNLNKGNRHYFAIDPGVANIQTPDSLNYQGDGEIFVYQLQNVGGDTCIVVFENTTYREIPPGTSTAAPLDTFILASGEQMYLNFQVTTLGEILVLQVMSSPNREWVSQEIAAAGSDYVLKTGDTMTGDLFLTSNNIIGGSTTTSDLNLKATSGAGTTSSDIHLLVGNNGDREAMKITNLGNTKIKTAGTGTVNSFSVERDSGEARITCMVYNDKFVHNIADNYPYFQMIRNNYYGAAYRPIVVADLLGRVGVRGPKDTAGNYNGDGGLGIDFFATENWTTSATGSRIAFRTTQLGTNTIYFPLDINNTVNHQSAVTVSGNGTVGNLFSVRQTFAGTEVFNILNGGGIGISYPSPTAKLQIAAGTGIAGQAPLKILNSTGLMATPEAGAFEIYLDSLYYTTGTGVVRQRIPWASEIVAGSGTVTSVDGSGGTTGLTLTGGPITTSGTLTLGGVLNKANGGSGSSGDVFWELTTSQVPTGNKRTTGTFHQGSGSPISGSSFGSTDGTYNTFFSGTAAFDETNFVNSEALALYSQQTTSTDKVKTYIVGFGNDTGNIGSTLNFGTRVHGLAGNVTFPIVVDGLQNLLNGATGAGGQGTCINGELGIEDGGGGSWDFDATISGGGTLDLAYGGAVQAFMVQGGGGIWTPSDKRLKTEIRELSVLDNIEEMRGVRYTFKKSGKKSIGVIAQEIQKFFPEAVTKSSNGFLAVDYQAVAAIALQGAKESSEKIDLLENQIFDLHKRLENLETQAGIIPRKKMGFLKRVFGKY